MISVKRLLGTGAVHLLIASLLLTPLPAAATKASPPRFEDNCKPIRKPIESIKNYQLNRIIGGAVVGGIVGGLTAVLSSQANPEYERDANGNIIYDQNGKPKKKGPNILGGVLAGAAAGGLIGWYSSLAQTKQNQEELRQAVNDQFSQDVGQFSPLAQSIADLGNCRRQQIFAVQLGYEKGELSKKEATKRLNTIEKWIKEDDKKISSASKQQTDTIKAYSQAHYMADGRDPAAVKQMDEAPMVELEGQSGEFQAQIVESYMTEDQAEIVQEAPKQYRYVSARNNANIRSAADPKAALVGSLARGTRVEIAPSTVQGWLQVTAENGMSGFMSEALLAESMPGVAPPPPPKPAAKPPGKSIKKLKAQPPSARTATSRDKVRQAAADRASVRNMIQADRAATADALSVARQSLLS